MSEITFTIVAPNYNEAASVDEFFRRIRDVMETLGEPWELVWVDDGSVDGSTDKIRAWHNQTPMFDRLFSRETLDIRLPSQLDSITVGGQAVIVMDSDLQDPPEVLPDLIAKWREGYEVVYAVRKEREGETWFKLFTARLFYRIIYRITDVNIPLDTGDFRLMDRKAVDVLNSMRERYRFLRGMSAWVGFRQVGVPYKRAARYAGETKYPLKKMIRFASDAITGFSYFPLQVATYLGFVSAGLSILAIPVVIAFRLAGSQAFFGQATTLIAVLFLGGVQLISLGILGEYIGRLYDEAKSRPLYIVREAPELTTKNT